MIVPSQTGLQGHCSDRRESAGPVNSCSCVGHTVDAAVAAPRGRRVRPARRWWNACRIAGSAHRSSCCGSCALCGSTRYCVGGQFGYATEARELSASSSQALEHRASPSSTKLFSASSSRAVGLGSRGDEGDPCAAEGRHRSSLILVFSWSWWHPLSANTGRRRSGGESSAGQVLHRTRRFGV